MTEVLYGLDTAKRERVAALRAQGDFYWLDASLSETTLDDPRQSLRIPQRTLQALPNALLEALLASTFDALEEVELRLDALAAMWTDGVQREPSIPHPQP